MLGVWIVFVFASFFVSIMTMNYFHFRRWFGGDVGQEVLDLRSWSGTYEFLWKQRRPYQRILLWTGFTAVFLTLLGGAIATLIVRFR